jgi:hypothetical protein
MNIKTHKTKFVTIKPGDADFLLKDNFVVGHRAGFEISSRCPHNYREVIQECINYGWLIPVATMYDHEITFARMKYE